MSKQTSTKRANFWRALSLLLNSGVEYLTALEIAPLAADKEFKSIASDLKGSIAEGGSLSGPMEKHRETFSAFEIAMVRAGEQSGNIDVIAEKLAEFLADVSFPVEEKQGEPAEVVEEEAEADLAGALEEAHQAPVMRLVDKIIAQAIREGATDIHIEPFPEESKLRYRIDGNLQSRQSSPRNLHNAIVSRIKIMAKMNIAEMRLPQDGRIAVSIGEKKFELRVAMFPSLYGESVTIRVLDKSSRVLTLAELGMTTETHQAFYDVLHKPHGLILVTGPTGSGKSTTLYAALNEINTPSVKVLTVEDPIEYDIPGAIQGAVKQEIGLTHAAMLKSVMRQDPDVILVSELRDKETIGIAIEAALTGHLVLSVLHADDAPSSLTRLLDIGAEPFLVADAVEMVLAQRLVRKLCTECKEALEPSEELRQAFAECQIEVPDKVYKAVGCDDCNNGYKGRTPIHEMLVMNEELKKLVAQQASTEEIRSAARKAGMKTLLEDGMAKVASGITSVEQVQRVVL